MQNIGFELARTLIGQNIQTLPAAPIAMEDSVGHVLAEEARSQVDVPPDAVSAMDGFAVSHPDTGEATEENPQILPISGSSVAGADCVGQLAMHTASRITTGAMIPLNADAVIEEELVRQREGDRLEIPQPIEAGRNIRPAGADIFRGQLLAKKGMVLTPGLVGYLAAAGLRQLPAIRRPQVSVVGVGDELVPLGEKLDRGQIYASNLAFVRTWLHQRFIPSRGEIVGDDVVQLRNTIETALDSSDALITCGGAWGSSRDLVLSVLKSMGMSLVFRRVLMAPGKGMAFGVMGNKPVYCLPGGPPACEMSFLQLVLPAIQRQAGHAEELFPLISARLTGDAVCKKKDWTVFINAALSRGEQGFSVNPSARLNRMEAMARTNCLVKIPEGKLCLEQGSLTQVQVLSWN